jgi:hypothetical protein
MNRETRNEARWLLLVHQLPKDPPYLRAKVGRQLARVGAVAVKNSVYVLPARDGTRESFHWIARETRGAGADATVFEADVVDGLSDAEIEDRFRAAVAPDLEELARETRETLADLQKGGLSGPADVAKLRKRLDALIAIDFFGAHRRGDILALIAECERHVRSGDARRALAKVDVRELVGRTWGTRTGVHVDRIASAWLIRRFIDPGAKFVFFPKDQPPEDSKILLFDTFGGHFTHEGDLCTFEVLAARADLLDAGLEPIAEIIHDLDIEDARYQRPELPGVIAALNGIVWNHPGDLERIDAATPMFDGLYEAFRRRAR